jgi:hypothetical protein
MAKRKSQGIGLINSPEAFKDLRIKIVSKLKNLGVENGWDNAKKNSFIFFTISTHYRSLKNRK